MNSSKTKPNNVNEQREEVNKAGCLRICLFSQKKELVLSGYVKKRRKY